MAALLLPINCHTIFLYRSRRLPLENAVNDLNRASDEAPDTSEDPRAFFIFIFLTYCFFR